MHMGDAIVAGVPERNGDKHASEIGNMSLDLLTTCSDLEILNISIPSSRIGLRIGIHTGERYLHLNNAPIPLILHIVLVNLK